MSLGIIAITMQDTSRPQAGFSYSRDFFEGLVDTAIAHARKLGATDAGAEASEGSGLSVGVRNGALETVEQSRDKSLGVTVYVGQRRGNASTSDFSAAAIQSTVQAAYDIARFTAEDPAAGLPDVQDVASEARELDLFHPWPISSEEAAALALRCERAALGVSRRITNSEGAGVSAQQSHFFSAHTHGFRGGYASSRHSLSVAPIASLPGKGADMQRDYWYSSMRDARELAAPEAVGRYAAERALSRLGHRRLSTRQCPVLFESPLAAGLLGHFVQGVSGGALYRRTTFLLDSLGKPVFPKHIDIDEDPFVRGGKGSSPFDDEGVRVQARQLVDGGRVLGYFLGPQKPDPEKNSAYECGFPAFDDARMQFDVRYYLVAILFILFDLEVAFLVPWAVVLKEMGSVAFWSGMIFLLILTVGFVYEWKKGALDWE